MAVGYRLLVVDDELAQLTALCSLLEDQGFRVKALASPRDALEHLKSNRCDLLLSDLKLPDMSGIELIMKAMAIDPDLSTILMTGHGSLETAIEALQIGVQDYVLKPFKLSTILPVINKALRYRVLKLENQSLLKRLSAQNHQLSELNSELDSFAGRVAHDLNSVIHLINGYSSSLTSRISTNLSEQEIRYIKRIQESATRGGQLVSDLLSFARLGASEITWVEVDLQTLVSKAKVIAELEHAGPAADWNIAKLPVVRGDFALLERVFVNLFSNALKFSRNNPSPRIEVDASESSEWFHVRIKDNGVGFDPNLANNLFKPFQRLHGKHEFDGHGIGLANVKKILDRHHAGISASSEPGQWTVFTLSFPKVIAHPTTADAWQNGSDVLGETAPLALEAELQKMSGLMGQFGGWAIQFNPDPEVVWTEEVYSIVEAEEPVKNSV